MKLKKLIPIVIIFIIGGFFAGLLSINVIKAQITQMVGLAVAQTDIRWNRLRDAAQGDNLTNGILVSGQYGFDGTNWDRVRITSSGAYLLPETSLQTLLNAVAVPTIGASFDIGFVTSKHVFEIDVAGPPPNQTTNLEGSINNVNFYPIDISTSVVDEMRHVINKPIRYVRANCTALGGGTITVRYIGGGN